MTLVEVAVSLAIAAVAVAGTVSAYLFSSTSAEQSALSLAANAKAMERIEETRSARWDISSWPAVDQLVATNFADEIVKLDLAGSGTGVTYATNMTRISLVSTNPYLKKIRVDCIWRMGRSRVFTNSIETCRAPDQ